MEFTTTCFARLQVPNHSSPCIHSVCERNVLSTPDAIVPLLFHSKELMAARVVALGEVLIRWPSTPESPDKILVADPDGLRASIVLQSQRARNAIPPTNFVSVSSHHRAYYICHYIFYVVTQPCIFMQPSICDGKVSFWNDVFSLEIRYFYVSWN